MTGHHHAGIAKGTTLVWLRIAVDNRDLVSALRRLSPEQREPLLLVGVEQLTYAEVAEVLHIPVGTVMSRVSRARAALRRQLDGTEPSSARHLRRVI